MSVPAPAATRAAVAVSGQVVRPASSTTSFTGTQPSGAPSSADTTSAAVAPSPPASTSASRAPGTVRAGLSTLRALRSPVSRGATTAPGRIC
ncbi:hypothetical protein GCM10020220_096530 [Nonomuraea rubra]|uniref:hypothetical protein n=1 Tax=Nonomuraea rubra TaxID=46180 RepID=UPI0031E5C326